MKWLTIPHYSHYGMLLILAGLFLLTNPASHTLPHLPHNAQPVHNRATTPTTPVATATPLTVPQAPLASSLGLADSTQHWIDVAWRDAWQVEDTKTDTFPLIFVKQIRQESGYQVSVVSSAGAIGIAQFMSGTASSLGVNPYNPDSALLGAAKLMVSYIHKYHSYALALASYNAGSATVDSCLTTPNWYDCLPLETENYITNILG